MHLQAHRPFHRPARTYPAPVEGGELRVPAPPHAPATPGSPVQVLLPLLGSMGMLGFAVVSGQQRFVLMAGIMAGALVVAGVAGHSMRVRRSRRESADRHRRYLDHLLALEVRLAEHAARRSHHDRVMVPPAGDLWSVVADGGRIWERRDGDGDFTVVRLGTGRAPAALRPVPTETTDPTQAPEPELAEAARRLVESHDVVEDVALTVDLRRHGCVAVIGDPRATRALVRSMLVQLAVWCAPDDLRIVIAGRRGTARHWEWTRVLPHLDVDGAALATSDAADVTGRLEHLLRPRLAAVEDGPTASPAADGRIAPHVVVVLDGYQPRDGPGALPLVDRCLTRAPTLSTTFLCLATNGRLVPSAASMILSVGEGRLTIAEARPTALPRPPGIPDAADPTLSRVIAEALSPLRLQNRSGRATSIESPDLLELLDDPGRPGALRSPIGVTGDGRPLELDLGEASAGGMGPHGMLIGATGSGKSELLRTLVLGLAARHDPDELALVLVDYKGGATFAELDLLPHSAGLVTNLERDPVLVGRMLGALHGELDRRQRILHGAGGVESVARYRERRRAEPSLEPMPSLLVVVDEFGELVAAHPEFSDLFETIGRVGRSLGVHLLLSTQRMEEGRLRRLEGHLRYRLCLRTFTPEESMTVLGSRAAAELPPIPGVGYLKVDGTTTAFKAARVAGSRGGDDSTRPRIVEPAAGEEMGAGFALVEELARRSPRTRQVWTEPLADSVPLTDLLAPARATGAAAAPIGLLDDPHAQTVHRLLVDLEADGNLALVGGPRSGKSVALQSLVLSLAAHHDPFDLQVYAVDLGGGGLALLDGLPHVGAVLGRGDHRGVARLVRRLAALVERRAEAFRQHRLAGMDEYRRLRADGSVDDEHGETVVLVDNWAAFVAELPEEVVDGLGRLASSGPHYGIHLVVATGRWQDLRPAVRDGFGSRLELRLSEPLDSEIDRRRAAEIPPRVPGRGIARCGRALQVAFAGSPETTAGLVDAIARGWADSPAAPLLHTLPDRVTLDEIPVDGPGALTLGLVEHGLAPWTVDLFGADPHLVVLGDAESGKTNLLRAAARRLAGAPGPVRIAVIDYRGDLRGEPPPAELLGSAASPREATELSERLLATVGDATSGGRLRRTVLLVDDYDLVAGASGNPLTALLDVLARGRDVGFHVVLARRVGGVARSAFEPVYQRIREMGTPGVVLSGDPAEGVVLGGARAEIRPPGRGLWVARGTSTEVQVGLVDREAAAVYRFGRRAG